MEELIRRFKIIGETVFVRAARHGSAETLELHLGRGADFQAQNLFGRTVLMVAAQKNLTVVIEILPDAICQPFADFLESPAIFFGESEEVLGEERLANKKAGL